MRRVILQTACPEIWNDLCDVARLFLGECEIAQEGEGEIHISHEIAGGAHVARVEGVSARVPLAPDSPDALEQRRQRKRGAKNALYQALKNWTGRKAPCGGLTGIRPTRLYAEPRAAGKGAEAAVEALVETFDVDRGKAQLLRDIAREQASVPAPAPGEIDVYVGIPFCRTRCSYCSFAALDMKHGAKLTGAYVEAIAREMRLVAQDLSAFRSTSAAERPRPFRPGSSPASSTARCAAFRARASSRWRPAGRTPSRRTSSAFCGTPARRASPSTPRP